MSSNKVLDRGFGYSRRVTQYKRLWNCKTFVFAFYLFIYLFVCLFVCGSSIALLAFYIYTSLCFILSPLCFVFFSVLRRGCYVSTATSPPAGESGEGFSLLQSVQSSSAAHPSGVPRNFFRGGGVNKFSWGQRERGSEGGSPLVRGSGGSCSLVQEISFHVGKFSQFLVLQTIYDDNQFIYHCKCKTIVNRR